MSPPTTGSTYATFLSLSNLKYFMDKKKVLFPYEKVRPIQEDMIQEISQSINQGKKILVHAPTGIGKTISVLGPALKQSIDKNKVVMMLTARHTQHNLAIKTLKDISSKHELDFGVVDIIGKKWMCVVGGVERLNSGEFAEFCKSRKEDSLCEFYNNTYTKKELSVRARKFIDDLKKLGIKSSEEIIELAAEKKLCPYEISLELAKKANVIVADYFYLFNPEIFKKFAARTGRDLNDLIVVVDEGHNLADRVRELLSVNLSSFTIKRAITEARENGYPELSKTLEGMQNLLHEMFSVDSIDEKLVSKKDFVEKIVELDNSVSYETYEEDSKNLHTGEDEEEEKDSIDIAGAYETLKTEFEDIGFEILKTKKRSYIVSIAFFLEKWLGKDEGYVRLISKKYFRGEEIITLSYHCLDPSLITKEIIENVHSFVIMSGTLVPLQFYKDILGFEEDNKGFVYNSPFPDNNRLNLVIPKTTTKYSMRSQKQYQEIAKIAGEVSNSIKGNVIVFFPSYSLRDNIYPFFKFFCEKEVLLETPGLRKEEKKALIDDFKNQKEKGAVLLAVTSGSFGEGIDLPGDLLHGVIVVGIPLQPPDLETKELISYYDKRFGKGWDYGYLLPAITKVLQNAGRCIRSEEDKGVIVFLDQRYSWSTYYRCFPGDWAVKVSMNYLSEIDNFFDNHR